MGRGMDWLSNRPVNVRDYANDQAWRTVTDQRRTQQAPDQIRFGAISVDVHCVRDGDGFPRRFQMAGHLQLSSIVTWRMARCPQAPEDVSTLVFEPEAEELL